MSQSELICYSAVILNHLTSSIFLLLLLSLSIFLWSTLSSRLSQKYCTNVLDCIIIIILVKHIVQVMSYLCNFNEINIYLSTTIKIIRINRKENTASVGDVFVLLSLFVHRSILKRLGLWESEHRKPNETKITDVDRTDQEQEWFFSNAYFMKPIIRFYQQFKQTSFVRNVYVCDVYAPMLCCDLINMIIFISFYGQFTAQFDRNILQIINENKVPATFVVILLVQLILIIIDRALYLRRNVRGKLFFHVFQVIVVHIWLFLVLPRITRTKFCNNIAAQLWYIFKCIYFGYSSVQVQLGYPKRIAGNFITKRFNYVNQNLYRIYLLIPFLLELRTIMNWMCIGTALDLPSCLQLEGIYSRIYLFKCLKWAEKKHRTQHGVTRPKTTNYCLGALLLTLLILLLMFPLLFFAFTPSFYQPNPPNEVNVEIKLAGYLSIYQMTAQYTDLVPFTEADYNNLRSSIYSSNIQPTIEDSAYAFLRDFNPNDIHCVNLFATSVNLWEISQPIRDIVINNLRSNLTVPVRFSYTIVRNPPNQDDLENIAAVVTGENNVDITAEDQQT
ncbi:unnamed protein product [Rotaria sp. Silwood2]|nr:unnamed protein product [Rotaria sp. Silwood2]CAF4308407.1 unnamed protein product [Rotaria sp. Silwood2]